jgi:hypothetical protein
MFFQLSMSLLYHLKFLTVILIGFFKRLDTRSFIAFAVTLYWSSSESIGIDVLDCFIAMEY